MLHLSDAEKTALLSIVAVLIVTSPMDSALNVASYAENLTFVQGIISQDTTWTLSGSPYAITGNVTISNGTTLTIEPGVEIKFDGNFSLLINGSLYAVGTNDKWITFTSNNMIPRAGDWNTIKFATAENESFILGNCIVEYAENGVTIQNSGKAIIKNSSIINNYSSGIHVIGESNVIIKGNTIKLNNNGISSTGKVSSGIKVLNNIIDSNYNGIHLYASSEGISQIKNITISDNTFSSNENGIKFHVYPITSGWINNVTISRNTINFNKNGIYFYIWGGFGYFATNLIYDTLISENTVYSNEKYGIYLNCSGPWLGTIYRVSISDNKIMSNGIGVHLFANTHNQYIEFDVVISNNTVSANMDKGIYVFGGALREPEEGIRTNITGNSISYNAYGAFYEDDTDNIAHFNDIYNNTYGVYVSNGATVNATHNYWGDPTGPYNEILNTNGKGNSVNGDESDLVLKPFLTSAAVNRLPIAVLEVNETVVTTNQTITFDASKSTDNSRINGYFFDFGDGTNSSWTTQPLIVHAYTSPGTYTASLKVLDDLGLENNNTASATVKVQSTLVVFIAVNSEAVKSGENLTVTVRVTVELNSVSNANVTLFSDKGGVFSPKTEKTNSTGYIVSMCTAPTVTEKTVVTISAIATKTEYQSGQGQTEIDVLPRDATIGINFTWVLAAIVVAIILIALIFTVKMKKTVTQHEHND